MVDGSLESAMGRLFGGENKLAYFGPERLPGRPDGVQRDACSAGPLSDPKFFSEISESSSGAGERNTRLFDRVKKVCLKFISLLKLPFKGFSIIFCHICQF